MRSFVIGALLVLTLPGIAATAEDKGQDIAIQADQRLHGFGDSQVTLEMVLISASGETAKRNLRVQNIEDGRGGDKTLMVFDSPHDLAGTALLSFSHASGDDEQWLFLPALNRVKQVGARNKSGPFMGSEFAFEDIVTPYWQKYHYKFLREETCDALQCFVVERIPNDSNSGYSRQVMWVDREDYLIRRVDYYDHRNALLKTYKAMGFKKYANQYWRPAEMLMSNQQNGKQTKLAWNDYRFKTGLKSDDFTQNALLRVK